MFYDTFPPILKPRFKNVCGIRLLFVKFCVIIKLLYFDIQSYQLYKKENHS